MKLGKSIKIALVQSEKNQQWLADRLGTTKQQVSNWCSTGRMHDERIVEISGIFGMKVSEFIALGED